MFCKQKPKVSQELIVLLCGQGCAVLYGTVMAAYLYNALILGSPTFINASAHDVINHRCNVHAAAPYYVLARYLGTI